LKQKLLVTGAAGQLGSEIIRQFETEYNLLSVVRDPDWIPAGSTDIVNLDITDAMAFRKVIRDFSPHIVINTAAYTNVDGCEREPDLAYRVNTIAVETIMQSVRAETLLIQLSSDYVFDGSAGPYREDAVPCPVSEYGRSKWAAEQLILRHYPNHLIIRPNVLYNSDPESTASFFGWIYRSLSAGQTIRVVTDQTSNPTYSADLVAAFSRAIEEQLTGLYHYGCHNYISRYDFALEIADIFNLDEKLMIPITTDDLQQTAPRPRHSGMAPGLIARLLQLKVHTTRQTLTDIKQECEIS